MASKIVIQLCNIFNFMFFFAALVLVPTRELCMQVYEILQKLVHRFHWIVPGYIMGGENRSKEKARLRKGQERISLHPTLLLLKLLQSFSCPAIIFVSFLLLGISVLVATPGRLLDHLKKTTSFKYNNLQWIVFDEADRSDLSNYCLFAMLYLFPSNHQPSLVFFFLIRGDVSLAEWSGLFPYLHKISWDHPIPQLCISL